MPGSAGDTDVENRLPGSVGGGKGDDLREWHSDRYLTVCEAGDQGKFNAEAEHPEVLQDNPGGWAGEAGGWGGAGCTRVLLWPIHVAVWQKPSQNCKVIILQLK